MLKRDEFLQKVVNLNNQVYLDSILSNLESFVDKELSKEDNIFMFINNHPSGYDSTSGAYTDGIVSQLQYNPTSAIHRNPDVTSRSAVGKTGNYTIWTTDSVDLILDGTLVNNTPWLDKTTDNKILGEISIKLPEKTNKNLALLLADKYRSIKIGSDGRPSGGYWGYVPLPVKPEYGSTSGLTYPDAVIVKQQGNDLFMIFRLYP